MRNGRIWRLTLAAGMALAVAAGTWAAAWPATGAGTLAGFLRAYRPAAIGLCGGAFFALLLAGVWRAARAMNQGPRAHSPKSGQEGTAAVEMTLLLPFALMIVLMMIQSMMLVTGNFAVHKAAYDAARAAVVWVGEKVSYDEPRNVVVPEDLTGKMGHIKGAAVFSLLPVSNPTPGVGDASLVADADAPGVGIQRVYQLSGQNPPRWATNMVRPKYEYAATYTEVALDGPVNGTAYGDHENLKVTVGFAVPLTVPYASKVMLWLGAARELGSGSAIGTDAQATCVLPNEGVEDEIDVEQFPRYEGR
jgi:hypothetical protein